MTIPATIATGGHVTDPEIVDAQLAILQLLAVFTNGVLNAANGGTGTATSPLPIASGGTGSSTQNFVDLTTNQSIAGNKTFSGQTELDQGGTVSNINSALTVKYNGSGTGSGNSIMLVPNNSSGGWNGSVLANDFTVVAVGNGGAVDTGVLNLTAWSNTPCGLRIKYDGTNVFTGSVTSSRVVLAYSATIATNAALGNIFSITATNGTAFTISNPTNLVTGQRIVYLIRNTSGGALGVVTWGGTFKLNGGATGFVTSATANSRSVEFVYDGTNLIELWRGTLDVPN